MVSRRVPLPVLLGATVLVIVAVAVVLTRRDGGSAGPTPQAVKTVDLEAFGDDGSTARLGDLLDGKPLVVNFFAEWCQPCREEMPAFEQVHQEVAGEVGFVGIGSIVRQTDEAIELVDETGVTYPVYADPTGTVLALFEGTGMPVTVFVDPDGTVRETHLEELDADGLRARIAEHFGVTGA